MLDIQDVFNNCEKALLTSASGIVNVETKPPTVWKSPTNIVPNKELDPLQPKPVQVKPVLVQFKSNNESNDDLSKVAKAKIFNKNIR